MTKMNMKLFLMVCFALCSIAKADKQVSVTVVTSGLLDAVIAGESSVVFNGLKYKYKLDEKNSVLSSDEVEPKAIKLGELQVGQNYFFEKVSYSKLDENPKASDFKYIVFITDTKPMELE